MIGHTVSRYTILLRLGGGGMGVVYEAEDAELGRRVAIKFLSEKEKASRSTKALDLFKREARGVGVESPHICTVHDIGIYEGRPFLVMERLRGETVKSAIKRRSFSVEKIASLAKILDYGLAKKTLGARASRFKRLEKDPRYAALREKMRLPL